jgi:predicted  nucleic acid-binding Zn-ribbon protein
MSNSEDLKDNFDKIKTTIEDLQENIRRLENDLEKLENDYQKNISNIKTIKEQRPIVILLSFIFILLYLYYFSEFINFLRG